MKQSIIIYLFLLLTSTLYAVSINPDSNNTAQSEGTELNALKKRVNQLEKELASYKKVKPVVFSSFYPTDSDDYSNLRDALNKLKITDNSLTFEPENSQALGFGFKCGFLGLLHLEIIKERIEREYEIPLLVTIPSVKYKIYLLQLKLLDF